MSDHPQVLSFVSKKGGVSKTTSAANLAVTLAAAGQRVLAVDVDSQANLTICLGGATVVAPERTIAEALEDPSLDLSTVIYRCPVAEGVDLLPARPRDHTLKLSRVEGALNGKLQWDRYLTNLIAELPGRYDWVIVDTPPNLGPLTLNALVAAHWLIVPARPEVLSYWAFEEVLDTVNDVRRAGGALRPDGLLGMLLTQTEPNRRLARQVRDQVTELGLPKLDVEIPKRAIVEESPGRGAPVCVTHPDSAPSVAYHQLAGLVLDHVRASSMEVAA